MFTRYRELWIGLGAFTLFLILFGILALVGWPGGFDSCTTETPNTCFCEAFNTGQATGIQQPANTWSNLGYVISGLLILWLLGRDRMRSAPAQDPFQVPTLFSNLYGALVLFLGPASMLFHGTLRQWGGWADGFSLVLFGTFLFLYDLKQMLGLSNLLFLILFIAIVVPVGILAMFASDATIIGLSVSSFFFMIFVIAFLILDIVILFFHAGGIVRQATPWWWISIGSFGASFFGFWLWSNTGGPLCDPTSLLQGHAAWQLLSAVTTFGLFMYFRTEQSSRSSIG